MGMGLRAGLAVVWRSARWLSEFYMRQNGKHLMAIILGSSGVGKTELVKAPPEQTALKGKGGSYAD